MIGRISNSVNYAHRGIHQVEPVQVIAPRKGNGQDEEQDGQMPSGGPRVAMCRAPLKPFSPAYAYSATTATSASTVGR